MADGRRAGEMRFMHPDDADRAAVKRVVDGYSDALNHREWDAVRGFFLPDATWRTANFRTFGFEGGDAIVAGLRAIVGPMDLLVQLPAATRVEVNGDEASARSSVQEFGKQGDAGFLCLGSYDDRLRRVGAEWRFASRVFTYRYWEEDGLRGRAFRPDGG